MHTVAERLIAAGDWHDAAEKGWLAARKIPNSLPEENRYDNPQPPTYAAVVAPADREAFRKLADQWEDETVLLSRSDQATEHPSCQAIVKMGEPAIQAILEIMQVNGGHWFHALQDITGANPVKPAERGNVTAMQAAWQKWGKQNGYT